MKDYKLVKVVVYYESMKRKSERWSKPSEKDLKSLDIKGELKTCRPQFFFLRPQVCNNTQVSTE